MSYEALAARAETMTSNIHRLEDALQAKINASEVLSTEDFNAWTEIIVLRAGLAACYKLMAKLAPTETKRHGNWLERERSESAALDSILLLAGRVGAPPRQG